MADRLSILCEQQGWSNETLGDLAWNYIEQHNLLQQFLEYLEDVAKEENEYCPIERQEHMMDPGYIYDLTHHSDY